MRALLFVCLVTIAAVVTHVGWVTADECPPVDPPNSAPVALAPAPTDTGACTNVAAGGIRAGRECYINKPSPGNSATWNCWCKKVTDAAAWCQPLTDGCTDYKNQKCNYGFMGNKDD